MRGDGWLAGGCCEVHQPLIIKIWRRGNNENISGVR
jgi:hypothetical protein